jgi:hypothetical protein
MAVTCNDAPQITNYNCRISECPANRLERAFALPGENAARQISPFGSTQLAVAERA